MSDTADEMRKKNIFNIIVQIYKELARQDSQMKIIIIRKASNCLKGERKKKKRAALLAAVNSVFVPLITRPS